MSKQMEETADNEFAEYNVSYILMLLLLLWWFSRILLFQRTEVQKSETECNAHFFNLDFIWDAQKI